MKLSDGRKFYAKTIVSNATRWDTFGKSSRKPAYFICFLKMLCLRPNTAVLWHI